MLKQDEYLWKIGKWEGLIPGCDWLSRESNPDLNVDKFPKDLLWTIQILHHVAFATDNRNVVIANAKSGKGLLDVVRMLLQFITLSFE